MSRFEIKVEVEHDTFSGKGFSRIFVPASTTAADRADALHLAIRMDIDEWEQYMPDNVAARYVEPWDPSGGTNALLYTGRFHLDADAYVKQCAREGLRVLPKFLSLRGRGDLSGRLVGWRGDGSHDDRLNL